MESMERVHLSMVQGYGLMVECGERVCPVPHISYGGKKV